MKVGSRFGNSPDFKTYYNCAETYHCLKGEFTFHCPETGEVHVLRKGDTLYFPPNTWHWGYNFGSETSHILECLTPRTRGSGRGLCGEAALADGHPLRPARCDRQLSAGRGARRSSAPRSSAPGDYVYEIVGEKRPMRVGLVCSTEMLTVGIVDLHRRTGMRIRSAIPATR